MSTTTFNAINASLVQAPRHSAMGPVSMQFAQMRASLPDLPAEAGFAAGALTVASRLALAAIPFAALGWLFVAR